MLTCDFFFIIIIFISHTKTSGQAPKDWNVSSKHEQYGDRIDFPFEIFYFIITFMKNLWRLVGGFTQWSGNSGGEKFFEGIKVCRNIDLNYLRYLENTYFYGILRYVIEVSQKWFSLNFFDRCHKIFFYAYQIVVICSFTGGR